MFFLKKRLPVVLIVCLLLKTGAVHSAQELDWLPDTANEPGASPKAVASGSDRMFLEAAVDAGRGSGSNASSRHGNLGFDWSLSRPWAGQWQVQSSGRVDFDAYPAMGVDHHNLSLSLRELFATNRWEGVDLDLGRMNIRDGVANGYSPSDVFRGGALPIRRTEDPARLRESRLGVLAGRASWHGDFGDLAALVTPHLHASTTPRWYDPNLGAVNDGKAQAYFKYTPVRWQGLYSNLILHSTENGAATLALNLSQSLGQSVVTYAELARTRRPPLVDVLTSADAPRQARNQAALGMSWTSESRQTLTVEYAYNGAGLSTEQWQATRKRAAAADLQRAFAASTWRQDPLNRESLMLMLQWDRFGHLDADLTCLARFNHGDRSRMAWCEWRYKQDAAEWSASLTRLIGDPLSEFGAAGQSVALGMKARFFF